LTDLGTVGKKAVKWILKEQGARIRTRSVFLNGKFSFLDIVNAVMNVRISLQWGNVYDHQRAL
jgi:hypothetical protein